MKGCEKMFNIKDAGAYGDGLHDDSSIINEAVKEYRSVYIPCGTYLIQNTLKLPSGTHIYASPCAVIKIADGAQKGRYDFLLTNDDTENGNCDISISGGIWDGNCMNNDRGNDLFDKNATTGSLFSFRNVKDLSVTDVTLRDPLCYYMRFCQAENVKIENIRFASENIVANQDGIHIAGYCRNFTIRNLYGTYGSPNDDFLAFNADDSLVRQESFDFINGPIENVLVENVYSEKCHCFVRLLSIDSAIDNVVIRNISGDCKGAAICMDGARGCRVPLFKEEDKPNGIGNIKNVLIENVSVSHSEDRSAPYVSLQTNCESFTVKNFTGLNEDGHFTDILHTCPHTVETDIPGYPEKVDRNAPVTIKENSVRSFSFKRIK